MSDQALMVVTNRLSTADRVRVVSALVEGNSIRSIVRMVARRSWRFSPWG